MGNPSTINPKLTAEIDELIGIFPYFQGAYMLMLRGLKNSADLRFQNRLHQDAIYVANREALYYLLNCEEQSEMSADISNPTDDNNDQDKAKLSVETPEAGTLAAVSENSEEMSNVIPDEAVDEQETFSIVGKVELANSLDVKDESPLSVSQPADMDHLRVELLELDNDEEFNDNPVYSSNSEEVTGNDPVDVNPETSIEAQGNSNAESSTSLSDKPSVPVQSESRLLSEGDLIDKFLAENPRITPSRERQAAQQDDISKPFTEQTDGLVSETLAKIYVKQKYYSRAIDIYDKLCLKYPEKSSYFASQIKSIKELINS